MRQVRHWLALLVIVTATLLVTPQVEAARSTVTHAGGGYGSIGTARRFGIGLDGGSPYYGLNIKYFTSHGTALQFTIGAHNYKWRWLGLKAEYLIHPVILAHGPSLDIPFYVGGGLGLGFQPDYAPLVNLHVPLGIAFQFDPVPIDLFLQLEPGINLFDYFDFQVGFGAGVRIFF